MIDEKKLIEEFTKIPDRDWYTPWIVDVINAQPKVNYPLGDCVGDCKSCWKTKIVTDTNVGSKWIPCKHELPKTNGVYQVKRVVYEGYFKNHIVTCAYFDGQNTWHNDNRVNHSRPYLKDIIAWKPLDDAYKGE